MYVRENKHYHILPDSNLAFRSQPLAKIIHEIYIYRYRRQNELCIGAGKRCYFSVDILYFEVDVFCFRKYHPLPPRPKPTNNQAEDSILHRYTIQCSRVGSKRRWRKATLDGMCFPWIPDGIHITHICMLKQANLEATNRIYFSRERRLCIYVYICV